MGENWDCREDYEFAERTQSAYDIRIRPGDVLALAALAGAKVAAFGVAVSLAGDGAPPAIYADAAGAVDENAEATSSRASFGVVNIPTELAGDRLALTGRLSDGMVVSRLRVWGRPGWITYATLLPLERGH
jgi:hypothetical protein